MDVCAGYLHEIDLLLEDYQEVPLYLDIFEAADPEMGKITAKNAEIEEKSTTLLDKAIKTVRNIFMKIKEMIHTIFTWMGMSKDEKTAYQQFVKEAKTNREFAGMTVTVHDFRKINDEYNRTLKEYENYYKQIKDEEADSRLTIGDMAEEKLKDLGGKAKRILLAEGTSFTVEAALNYASACRENALRVEQMLQFDMGLLDALEKELGKRETRRFKRKIHSLTKKHRLLSLIGRGRQEQTKTLKDSVKEVISSIKGVGKAFDKDSYKNAEDEAAVKKSIKTVADIHLRASNHRSTAHHELKQVNKLGGKVAVGALSGTMKQRKYAADAFNDQINNEVRTLKKEKKAQERENRLAEKTQRKLEKASKKSSN